MSFQWIFDRCEAISIDKRPIVGQTITRSNVVRSTSLGGDTWRFEVKLPDGITWKELRPLIQAAESLDRHTSATVKLNNPGYTDWLSKYQGDSASVSGFAASVTQGLTSITLTSSPSTPSGYKFRAGDLIQLGASGRVYTVKADVAYNSNTVNLNRAVIDATGSYSLVVGPEVQWTVVCTQFPTWSIFSRDQVSWNGSFVFREVF